MSSEEAKLNEIFNKSHELKLPNGKVLRFGSFTLRHAMWIEEKYGSLEEFEKKVLQNEKTISDKINLIFNLLENNEDFEDVQEFAASIPMTSLVALMDLMNKAVMSAMPNIESSPEEGAEEKK